MKLVGLFVCAIAGAPLMTHGQGAVQSTVDVQAKKNEQNPPAPTPSGSPELPELSQLDEIFKQTSLGKTADEYRTHVEWRRLQNQVANDPAVVAAKKAAESAHTDLEKRKRLGNYYNTYYKRMEALAGSAEMKAALAGFKAAHLGMLIQPRVRPSPSPTLLATPSPTATPVPSEPPLPSAAPSPSPPTGGPAPSPAILPTPIPLPSALSLPSAAPSPSGTQEGER
jgi:hypothetical protein